VRRTKWVALALGVLVAACGGGGDARDSDEEDGANAVVLEVVDGDTIVVEVDGAEERVRLVGIDTPETKHPRKPVECFGPEASEFTASLLPPGTPVLIERDLVGRDDYGRLLGYVHVPAADLFVNREIVRRGYARPMTIEPNSTYAAEFADDARAAERENLGIWAECSS
jgi:micrococcal nuclease